MSEEQTTQAEAPAAQESEAFASSSQTVADAMEQALRQPGESEGDEAKSTPEAGDDGSDGEDGGGAKGSIEDAVKAESQDSSPEGEVSEEVSEQTPNVQKRIDKLTAQRKEAEEKASEATSNLEKALGRIDALEKKVDGKDSSKDDGTPAAKEYSREDLRVALRKGMDEGNEELVMDVFEYQVDRMKKDIIGQYQEQESQKTEKVKLQQEAVAETKQEWTSIVKDFSPDSYEDDFLIKDPDFDMSDKDSVIFKITQSYLTDPEVAKTYVGKDGKFDKQGLRRAAQDAFNELLLQKTRKPNNKAGANLKANSLAKKNQKTSLGAGTSDAGNTGASDKDYNSKDDLTEAISEKKKFKDKRMPAHV